MIPRTCLRPLPDHRHRCSGSIAPNTPYNSLGIIEQCHEAKVHVKLHMAMEQSQPGVICNKINLHFLKTAQHSDILYDTGSMLASNLCDLKTVPVQVHRMYIIGCIAHAEPVSFPLFQMEHGIHAHHIESNAIDRPSVEPSISSLLFGKDHVNHLVRYWPLRIMLPE